MSNTNEYVISEDYQDPSGYGSSQNHNNDAKRINCGLTKDDVKYGLAKKLERILNLEDLTAMSR